MYKTSYHIFGTLLDRFQVEINEGGNRFRRQKKRRLFLSEFCEIEEKPEINRYSNLGIQVSEWGWTARNSIARQKVE
jgi:hypothetical protein